MRIFNVQLSLTIGSAALLITSLASSYQYIQSKSQQIQQYPTVENFASPKQQIKLASSSENSLNSLIGQTPSGTRNKQKTPASKQEYKVVDEFKNYKYSINGNQIFSPGKLPRTKIDFENADLLSVLTNTRQYFQDHASQDPDVMRTGIVGSSTVTVADVLKTLDFMIVVLEEDIANNRPTRLKDPNFINNNFRVIKWSAHNPQNPKQKRLRITKYAVFTHPGSHKKTSTFNTPIYSLKDNLADGNFYTRYTKRDVLSGIYEPGGREFGKVEPLAYLTRKGLEEALMEGTILVNFTDGSQEFFNVDRNNNMPYVRGVAPKSQKRYWYFRKVDAIKGYGYKIDAKISIKPGVTFAGDVLNIGLGKVIVLEYMNGGRKHLKLGVIADTGGAFLPNLHQLDFLAGVFQDQKDFGQHIQQLPEYATAYILVKK